MTEIIVYEYLGDNDVTSTKNQQLQYSAVFRCCNLTTLQHVQHIYLPLQSASAVLQGSLPLFVNKWHGSGAKNVCISNRDVLAWDRVNSATTTTKIN